MARQLEIPSEIYEDDKKCAEFILHINEQLSKVAEAKKMLKEAKAVAETQMIARLDATGMKHFAFADLGTFSRRASTKVDFPSDEQGGRAVADEWLLALIKNGIIDTQAILYLQQARLVEGGVLAIEEKACNHNWGVLMSAGLVSIKLVKEQQDAIEAGTLTHADVLASQQAYDKDADILPASPFNHFTEIKLASPRKPAKPLSSTKPTE